MIKQNIFTQFPSWVITHSKLTHFQFRLYTLLEYYRFTQINPTSDEIAEDLKFCSKNQKSFRDFIRHELNKFNELFPENFLRIYFKKNGIGNPHKIIVKFNYLNNEVTIDSQQNLNYNDLQSLTHFLKNSRYFSDHKPADLLNNNKSDFENLLRALIYVDSKSNIENPLRYLRSCFKNGVFKYDKEKFELEQIEVEKADYNKRLKKLARIDSPLMYGITRCDVEKIKQTKPDGLNFYTLKDEKYIYIYRATYHTKEANPKNWLNKLNIKYQIFIRGTK